MFHRPLQILTAGAIAFLPACAASVSEVRSSGSYSFQGGSAKSPDALSGCIAQAWIETADASSVSTIRREDGWTVFSGVDGVTFGLADVTQSGGRSSVSYRSNFKLIAEGKHIPAVKACL